MVEKRTKAEVDYSQGKPRGDHCGICEYFIPPKLGGDGDCKKVKPPPIRSYMWCRLFEPWD